jgi:hypothetical protein
LQEILVHERKLVVAGKFREIIFFKMARIIIEKIIDADDLVTSREEPFCEMRTDKTSNTCDQRLHGYPFFTNHAKSRLVNRHANSTQALFMPERSSGLD